MTETKDDLEAVRTIITTLEKFDVNDQERIIRWAREKLGLSVAPQTLANQSGQVQPSNQSHIKKDLKSFILEKNPTSDMQFAATVAYYYKFDSPDSEKKEAIDSQTLQDAARLAGRKRLSDPGQTLINASFNGMLDKTGEKGLYKINTVGENLVAMTLPQNSSIKKRKLTTVKKNKSKQTPKKK